MTSTDVGKMLEEADIIQQKERWKMDGKSVFYCIMQFSSYCMIPCFSITILTHLTTVCPTLHKHHFITLAWSVSCVKPMFTASKPKPVTFPVGGSDSLCTENTDTTQRRVSVRVFSNITADKKSVLI